MEDSHGWCGGCSRQGNGDIPSRRWIRMRGIIVLLGIFLLFLTIWDDQAWNDSTDIRLVAPSGTTLEDPTKEEEQIIKKTAGNEDPSRNGSKASLPSDVGKTVDASKETSDALFTSIHQEQEQPQKDGSTFTTKSVDNNASGPVVELDYESVNESTNERGETMYRPLIDFGIVGFEKSGTTFLVERIFSQSKQVFMAGAETGSEVTDLDAQDLDKLQAMFLPHWNETTKDTGAPIRRGFKNPMVCLSRPWLENLETNFPTMKFIVTVRHPISWFQSWYNYKLRRGHYDYPMPTPHETIGLCRDACRHKGPEGKCIKVRSPGCSGHANVHQYLSRMGYTPMISDDEWKLLDHHRMKLFNFSNTQLFLTELGQMSGKNTTVSYDLIRNIERFLDLEEHALPDIQPYRQPNYTWTEDKWEGRIEDICASEYADIRIHLLEIGRKAGLWIEKYFLPSPHVIVSDRQDLLHRIRQWKVDPCG